MFSRPNVCVCRKMREKGQLILTKKKTKLIPFASKYGRQFFVSFEAYFHYLNYFRGESSHFEVFILTHKYVRLRTYRTYKRALFYAHKKLLDLYIVYIL